MKTRLEAVREAKARLTADIQELYARKAANPDRRSLNFQADCLLGEAEATLSRMTDLEQRLLADPVAANGTFTG